MSIRIVADSSSDMLTLENADFVTVPLKVIVGDQVFCDDADVDLKELSAAIDNSPISPTTACPGVGEWLDAFGNAETVFCVTMTSALSGSCSACRAAKQNYEAEHPGRKVYLIDSLSIGPEMALIVERLNELILKEMPAEYIYRSILRYRRRTKLLFSLDRMQHCADNGRAGQNEAKGIGVMGIRAIGKASTRGDLEVLEKCRGKRQSMLSLIDHMKKLGYAGGRILIAHNQNEAEAQDLVQRIRQTFGKVDVRVQETRALCSFYAEQGSLLIGMEC